MSKINNYLVGSDPEVFLQNRETKQIVSAIPYVMGDKYEPYQIPELEEGCCIQTDNIMVEYCIPATNDPKKFLANLNQCIEFTENIIPTDLQVVIKPSARVNKDFLKDKKAKQFGCEPDFNVWSGTINPSPANNGNLRTCGGHVHIGYDNPDEDLNVKLIKALDIFLGIPSIILDFDKERKQMYGKAGAFRFKPYGIEYRSLSHFWIKDLELVSYVFEGVKFAIDFVNNGLIDKLTDTQQNDIQTCINTGNEELAMKLISQFSLNKMLIKSSIFID